MHPSAGAEDMEDSATLVKIKAIGRQPLSDRVYEALKKAIINGHLSTATKLREIDVARKMGVSPTPVREAFRRLATEGFLSSTPWRGVQVRSFSDAEIIEMYQCREVLEGLAGRLAADHLDTAGIKKLRRLVAASRKAATAAEVVELNAAFHGLICTYAKSNKLVSLLSLFYDMIQRDRTLTAYSPKRRRAIDAEHAMIVDALEARDRDRVENAMRQHIRNAFAYRFPMRSQH